MVLIREPQTLLSEASFLSFSLVPCYFLKLPLLRGAFAFQDAGAARNVARAAQDGAPSARNARRPQETRRKATSVLRKDQARSSSVFAGIPSSHYMQGVGNEGKSRMPGSRLPLSLFRWMKYSFAYCF